MAKPTRAQQEHANRDRPLHEGEPLSEAEQRRIERAQERQLDDQRRAGQ
jgi:hypothetical protein